MELDSLTMEPIEEASIALMEESTTTTHHQLLEMMMNETGSDDDCSGIMALDEDSGILDRATCMSVDDDDDDDQRSISNREAQPLQVPNPSDKNSKRPAAESHPKQNNVNINKNLKPPPSTQTMTMTPQHKQKHNEYNTYSSTYNQSATLVSPLTIANDNELPSSPSSPPSVSTSPTSVMTPVGMTSISNMSTIVGTTVNGDDDGGISPSSTHVVDDFMEPHHHRHSRRHRRPPKHLEDDNNENVEEHEHGQEHEVAPEALLGRLQRDDLVVVSPSDSHPNTGNNHTHTYIKVPEEENEGLISKRLQEIEFKKFALHKKRISLEQRLYDFVDSEKRMRVMIGSPLSSPSNRNNGSSSSLMNHSLQSTRSLLRPPTPSPHKLQLKHHQQQYSLMHAHQNGDEMVQDYPWKDPRAKNSNNEVVIAYYYSGPLNKFKQPHGVGTMKFLDGQEYEGQVYAGYRWGMGTNRWPDGQVYTGEWDDHSRNGRGTHTWKDGRRVTGQWSGGHLNGRVIFSWPNGASFDGECRMGKKHGRGTHTWANGRLYSGSFQNGKEHGFGSLTQSDWRYRGNFEKGKRSGIGMQIWRNKTYDGEWKDNKAHGKGRIVWQNGATYTGEFSCGKYHGLGGKSS